MLGDAARKAGADYVLTAHTLDDQAETVLFRLLRGSGVSGLRGMQAGSQFPGPMGPASRHRPFVDRPFFGIAKSRLLATLAAAKVRFADDPSNRDPRFTRPRLRELMPRLAEEGLTAGRLALLAARVTRVEMTLYDLLNEAQRRLAPGPLPAKGPIAIDESAFADLSDEIALRLLSRIVEWVGNEGPVELGKAEVLCEDLKMAVLEESGRC